jgi:hypothetical protein
MFFPEPRRDEGKKKETTDRRRRIIPRLLSEPLVEETFP